MQLNRLKQTLLLEGHLYTREELLGRGKHAINIQSSQTKPVGYESGQKLRTIGTSPFLAELYEFLADWFSDAPNLMVQTSGSTGKPKRMEVSKEKMMQSARLTCEVLQLSKGDSALLCMPLQYIAGKMMVVRALVCGLNLIVRTPSGHPLSDVHPPLRFVAMVPLQVFNTLQVPEERKCLEQTGTLIIGGGSIDARLEREIKTFPGAIYSTYGMTETLSHIALRRLNGPSASSCYRPFDTVKISLSPEKTLIISAPLVCDEILITNDVAQIFPDGSFLILGRKDNIINSGGIKIQTEVVEELLKPLLTVPFVLTSIPDPRLGQALVLLVERESTQEEGTSSEELHSLEGEALFPRDSQYMETLKHSICHFLPVYQRPREILQVSALPLTGTGKIDRTACRALAGKLISIT